MNAESFIILQDIIQLLTVHNNAKQQDQPSHAMLTNAHLTLQTAPNKSFGTPRVNILNDASERMELLGPHQLKGFAEHSAKEPYATTEGAMPLTPAPTPEWPPTNTDADCTASSTRRQAAAVCVNVLPYGTTDRHYTMTLTRENTQYYIQHFIIIY